MEPTLTMMSLLLAASLAQSGDPINRTQDCPITVAPIVVARDIKLIDRAVIDFDGATFVTNANAVPIGMIAAKINGTTVYLQVFAP